MKKIYLLLCFVACLLASCLEDKGNDLYIELNDVTIGKIRDTTVEQFTRLKIEPEITTRSGEFKAEDYTYLWYMYTTYGMSSLTSADTLSLEKNLDTEITCIPGDYSLVFKVMDKETGDNVYYGVCHFCHSYQFLFQGHDGIEQRRWRGECDFCEYRRYGDGECL